MGMGVKFRAWDKLNEEWIHIKSLNLWDDEELWYVEDFDGEVYFSTDNNWTLVRYTGLKDNNGVEIYEGDIVENGNGKVGYIVFLIQEAGFVVVLKDRDYRLGHRNTGEGYHMAGNHKVIGNVYTSPELLENN